MSGAANLDLADDSRAVGRTDWDQDGDLDLWLTNRNGPQLRFLRNDVPHDNRHVAIRLRGTTCNRDAIGARVAVILRGDDRELTRTLYAGDGYLAQSSKWLHFGLGSNAAIDRIEVRWPGGRLESFEGAAPDQRYELVQGRGKVELWPARGRELELAPTRLDLPVPGEEMTLYSATRMLMPPLPYKTLDGQAGRAFRIGGRPTLIVLWASWCAPCLVELRQLTNAEEELRAAGVEVVALSVDGLGDDQSSRSKAVAAIKRIGFPFEAGMADAGLIEKLQLVNNHLFDLHRPLVVPTSFLVDGSGRLAAVYKGQADLEVLKGHLEDLGLDLEARRRRSVPFEGKWHEGPKALSPGPFLGELMEQGYLDEAYEYLKTLPGVRQREMLPYIVKLGLIYHRRAEREKAADLFRAAMGIDPTYVEAELIIGQEYLQRGEHAVAIRLYREALRRNPKSVSAMNNLAWVLGSCPDEALRDGEGAVELASKAVEAAGSQDPGLLDTLAVALAEAGDFEQAVSVARKAEEICRKTDQVKLAETVGQHRRLFEQRQPYRSPR